MKKAIVQYSLKVWLSAVLITPLLYIIFSLIDGLRDSDLPVPAVYLVLVIAEVLFSFLAGLLFCAAAVIVVTKVASNIMGKSILSVIGLVLTAVTFLVFSSIIGAPLATSTLALAVPNAVCVVAACWYFKLSVTTKPI